MTENGYCQLTGAVKICNIYLKNNGFPRNETPFAILDKMKEQGITPNTATYNILLYICFKEGMHNVATELFDQCYQPESEVRPDIITFNTFIKGMIISYNKANKNIDLSPLNGFSSFSRGFLHSYQHLIHPYVN